MFTEHELKMRRTAHPKILLKKRMLIPNLKNLKNSWWYSGRGRMQTSEIDFVRGRIFNDLMLQGGKPCVQGGLAGLSWNTQEAIADNLNITQQTISNVIENFTKNGKTAKICKTWNLRKAARFIHDDSNGQVTEDRARNVYRRRCGPHGPSEDSLEETDAYSKLEKLEKTHGGIREGAGRPRCPRARGEYGKLVQVYQKQNTYPPRARGNH